MKIQCPKCGQGYEVDDSLAGNRFECSCGAKIDSEPGGIVKIEKIAKQFDGERKKSGYAVAIAAILCFCVAVTFNALSWLLFFFYLPFYLVAFILAIIAIAQKRVVVGTLLLIGCLFCPFFIPIMQYAARNADEQQKAARPREVTAQAVENDNKPAKPSQESSASAAKKEEPAAAPAAPAQPEKLTGMFGIKFGSKLIPNQSNFNSTLTSGETLYRVKPDKPFRDFKIYVRITPQTHLVWEIWADKEFDETVNALNESKVLKSMIEERYQVKETDMMFSMGDHKYRFPNGSILISGGTIGRTLTLRATDDDLMTQAEKERIAIEKSKTDLTAL